MRTTNGLDVPRIGEGGRPGACKPSTSKARPRTAKPTPPPEEKRP